jgi:uncharacterized protein with GYD domain
VRGQRLERALVQHVLGLRRHTPQKNLPCADTGPAVDSAANDPIVLLSPTTVSGNTLHRAAPQKERTRAMETYIMLTKLTDEGRKTLKQNPNRTKEVNKEIEGMGGKIVAQYAVLGPYDYVNVVEAADNKTVAKISMELGSRGTMEIMTLAAVNF